MMPPLPPDPAPRKYLRPRPAPDLPPLRATRVLDQLRERLRLMHYSLRTEETYVYWVKAFIRFHGLRHLLQSGSDIRTVRELLGHADVATTMIHTHVLKLGGGVVRSPLDALTGGELSHSGRW